MMVPWTEPRHNVGPSPQQRAGRRRSCRDKTTLLQYHCYLYLRRNSIAEKSIIEKEMGLAQRVQNICEYKQRTGA
jgi:hypothetical protein